MDTPKEKFESWADEASKWLEKAFRADFSPESLPKLDRLLENTDKFEFVCAQVDQRLRVLYFGMYIGDTVRRKKGGQWSWDSDSVNEEDVTLILPGVDPVFPMKFIKDKFEKRVQTTVEEWGKSLGLVFKKLPTARFIPPPV
jgi:hypothetical protein